jgi:AcrR family transcriptional regulator
MIDQPDTTKRRVINAAYRLLYREGFKRVSMDAIAAAAGVTKRTLYYHFDSKDTLVAAVLDHQHGEALALIRAWADPSSDSTADFLEVLFERLEAWASQPRWLGSGFTRLTMELADLPGHPARHAASRHKAAVEAWLADELAALGAARPDALAREVMLLIEGAVSLILIHGDTRYAAAAAGAARRLATSDLPDTSGHCPAAGVPDRS